MRSRRLYVPRVLVWGIALALAAIPGRDALADGNGGNGPRHARYHIYELMPPLMNASGAVALAASFGLQPAGTPGEVNPGPVQGPIAFEDAAGNVRGFFGDGSVRFFPDLAKPPNPNSIPNRRSALRTAMAFVDQIGGSGGMGELTVGGIVTLTEQPAQAAAAGGAGAGIAGAPPLGAIQIGRATDVLRTVEFVRTLDGLDVYGPGSILSVDVGAGGVAGGEITLRGVGNPGPPLDIISRGDAMKRFLAEFPYPVTGDDDEGGEDDAGGVSASAAAVAGGGLSGELQSVRLIYYEQGGRFVQPAYLFQVSIVGPTGARTGLNWLVPAVLDSPEPIVNRPAGEGPSPLLASPGTVLPALVCEQPPDIKYGRYILRDDDQGWLLDTQGFGANIDVGNGLRRLVTPGLPPVNDFQYFWNYPWLWEPSGSPPTDQSPYFPGSVNMALIEGHGLPWWISTEKNCCDVINLTAITGFGGFHTPGELTDYVIWQSCSVVPAPGDPYGGNYASPASPFDVWFTIFQGLRGTYGYRTEMNIWNGVGKAFGLDTGFGAPNLSAWFTECNNNVFHHNGGWNYGSAVVVSGQEGDTLYDTCPLPPPGSLTIWWQHP